jgi:hypothetical protein
MIYTVLLLIVVYLFAPLAGVAIFAGMVICTDRILTRCTRFSMRDLLIAVTLAALLMGAVVYVCKLVYLTL